MKKQTLIAIIVLMLGGSLIGCGKSDEKVQSDTTNVVDESQKFNVLTESANTDTSNWELHSIDPKGTVKCPTYFSSRTSGGGEYLYKVDSNPYFIVIDGGYEKELNADNYDDIFNNLLHRLGRDRYIQFGKQELLKDVKVECLTKESCKINGHDAYRYTAKTTGATNNKECYIYGYLSCTPKSSFTIYGIITDESQLDSDSLKKEIQTEVDAIMNTFETK